ncbi:MAG: hypothetical protein HY717_04525 [Planctomycetes bacterium]|nr:hypothetical protein [Planctomycetota bacterium]
MKKRLLFLAMLSVVRFLPRLAIAQGAAGEGEAYLFSIQNQEEFERFSLPERFLPGVDRTTKFMVPALDDPSLLPPIFQNVNLYNYHQDFLVAEFPDRFPGLSGPEYLALVERRASRKYFAGFIFRFKGEPDSTYSFDVFTLDGDRSELPRKEEMKWVHDQLAPVFKLGDPSYSPRSSDALKNAKTWIDPGFNINFSFGSGGADYIPYTIAQNYGRVRVFTEEEFTKANRTGAFSSQDIVVLEPAPADIEGVIAGAITGSFQSELGHLAIRSGIRGTPNAYVRNATTVFQPWNGKLVFLDVGANGYKVEPAATLEEAEAWWASHRPNLGARFNFEFDADYKKLDAVWDVSLDGSVRLVPRYGGKGSNFARLYSFLPEPARTPGFLVPMSYYIQFMATNRTSSFKDPSQKVTFAQYLEELLADPEFRGNSQSRFKALESWRDLIEKDGVVDPEVVKDIIFKILAVFGDPNKPVRCRSSSNAEDLLEFNGAGLYSSKGGCPADDLDADDLGPSRCDAAELDEDGVEEALKVVWASLWNFRAFEEREYFQVPHSKAKMAVLVSEAFPDELANGVAFTGNPTLRGDRRFVINAQAGDLSVVFTDPKVVAEKDILEMKDGQVTGIIRARASSEVPLGTFVLSDDQLKELGGLMALVESKYPLELEGHQPDEVILDFEWKLDRHTGRIRLKQVRPFLIASGASVEIPEIKLTVPEGMMLCASFMVNRPLKRVLELKAQAKLRAGEHRARADGTSGADLFEWLEFSPVGPRLAPLGKGVWTAERTGEPDPGLDFKMSQDFRTPEGELVRASVGKLLLRDDGPADIELDQEALTWAINPYILHLEFSFPGDGEDDNRRTTKFLPCDLSHLPLYNIDAEFEGGDRFHTEERFEDVLDGTGPAELFLGRVSLAGQVQEVTDYWRLAYSAGHHNDTPYPEHWIVLDPVLDLPGTGRVKAVAVAQGDKSLDSLPTAFLLDENFEKLKDLDIVLFRRQEEGTEEIPQFRRGDANSSGKVNVTDALVILRHLFAGGPLACPDAADFDDIGTVDMDDAILILFYLFLGLDPPAAPGSTRCGVDVEPDELEACIGAGCR